MKRRGKRPEIGRISDEREIRLSKIDCEEISELPADECRRSNCEYVHERRNSDRPPGTIANHLTNEERRQKRGLRLERECGAGPNRHASGPLTECVGNRKDATSSPDRVTLS